jgi:diacylglycerol kinase family enzyme
MKLLLAINTSAGTGHNPALGQEMATSLRQRLGPDHSVQMNWGHGHGEIRRHAGEFARQNKHDTVIIAGGGGGTLRAVIEGVGDSAGDGSLPAAEQLRIGALRMGSGNVIARQLGVARNPREGVEELAVQLLAKTTTNCCVIGCDTADQPAKLFGATLGGFGLFGRVPKCLETYHENQPRFHRFSAGLLGIERLTNVEYGLCLVGLSARAALNPERLDTVEVQQGEHIERFPLLAGALMNFPLGALPFQPGVSVEDAELSLHLIPFRSRMQALGLVACPKRNARTAKQFRITRETPITLRVLNRDRMSFFIDEDPIEAREITLRVAGRLAFVPGKDFNPKRN